MVAKFGLAVNQGKGEKEETIFFDVDCWDKQAEHVCAYLKKGSAVFVEGRLKEEKWTDKTTSQPRSKMTVTASQVTFLSTKKSEDEI
jgi:single-strand DNA-binding protein